MRVRSIIDFTGNGHPHNNAGQAVVCVPIRLWPKVTSIYWSTMRFSYPGTSRVPYISGTNVWCNLVNCMRYGVLNVPGGIVGTWRVGTCVRTCSCRDRHVQHEGARRESQPHPGTTPSHLRNPYWRTRISVGSPHCTT